jgi:hypothetical protein
MLLATGLTLSAQQLEFSGSNVGDQLQVSPTTSVVGDNVSVAPFSASGITAVPYNSPEFSALLNGGYLSPELASAFRELLPYSIFVKNDTNRAVIGYTVSWTTVDSTGFSFTDYVTTFDSITLKGLILPHGAGLAAIVVPVFPVSAQTSADIVAQATRLGNQQSVTVALEFVVFEDGSSIGRDNAQSRAYISARLRSEYDLYQSVLGRAGNDAISITSWLQTLVDQFKPGTKLHLGADPYPDLYKLGQAQSAANLLALASAKGVPAMTSSVQHTLQTKPYPPLIVTP